MTLAVTPLGGVKDTADLARSYYLPSVVDAVGNAISGTRQVW